MAPEPPTFEDVLAARERIAPHLRETALNRYPALDELVGTETWVKHENHLPIGAFKVRGGLTYVDGLVRSGRRVARTMSSSDELERHIREEGRCGRHGRGGDRGGGFDPARLT